MRTLREKKADDAKDTKREEQPFEINPLFQKDALKARQSKSSRKLQLGDCEESLNLGDEAKIEHKGSEHDGKEGIVKIVDGPDDTTGVMIDGELQMFPTRAVLRITGVQEVFAIDLARIAQLAGVPAVQPQQTEAEITIQPAIVTGVEPADETASGVHYALDEIERLIPKVQVKDLKGIRQRINSVQTRMNESPSRPKSFHDYLGEAKPVPPSGTIAPEYAAGGTPPKSPTSQPQSASGSPPQPTTTAPNVASGNGPNGGTSASPLTNTTAPTSTGKPTALGADRNAAVKALADRLDGDEAAAGTMFDAMQKTGAIAMKNGNLEMPEMDDATFDAQAALAKGR